MNPHPHAEVLRAIADGVPLSEFEASPTNDWCDASDLYHRIGDMVRFPEKWQIRRKPQHIMVNGFKVPKPLDVMPEFGDVFSASIEEEPLFSSCICCSTWAKRCFERGIAHATKEAAIAHAKAMLGIDPEYFK
jgi:hypothetical protein